MTGLFGHKQNLKRSLTLVTIMALVFVSIAFADSIIADADELVLQTPHGNGVTATQNGGTSAEYDFSAAIKNNKNNTNDDVFANLNDTVSVSISTSGEWATGITPFPASFTAYDAPQAGKISITVPCGTNGTVRTMSVTLVASASNGKSLNPDRVTLSYTITSGSDDSSCTPSDKTPPVLSLPSDFTVEATGPGGAEVSFSVSATDDVDGAVAVTCDPASESTFALGDTPVDCSATDAHGNPASGSFTVSVVDTIPPALSLPDDITTEATGSSGAPVSFLASANDLVDGAVDVTCSPSSGTNFALGDTPVNCSATDAHGNKGSGSFTVSVVDTTPPTLNLPVDITVEATSASGAAVSFSALASDLVDGAVDVTCSPASGTNFILGNTTVTCSATDAHINTASGSFKVSVVDTTPPTLNLPVDITVEATSASGAAVSFSALASDLVDGSVAASCAPASGSTFPLGETPVACSATDAHGNKASGSFKVSVVDTTPPVLTVPADMNVPATSPAGAVVVYSATASDLVDPSPVVTCTPASGSTFAPGKTTVSCTAADAAGNSAAATFTIWVTYQLKGFYQPVDMSLGSNLVYNTVKNGSTVPLKFEIFAGTTELTDTSSVYSFKYTLGNCSPTAQEDTIETLSSGSTVLRYDSVGGQFIFNWQTPKNPGGCYRVTMTAQDGSSLVAYFKLK